MLNTLGIVQACFKSDGFLAHARRRVGGRPLMEWVVRRMTDCQQLDAVVVMTSQGETQKELADLVPLDVPVVVTDAPTLMGRFAQVLERFQAKSFVRIRANQPFVDPSLIDQLVASSNHDSEPDYVTYCMKNGRPAILSPCGLFAEWVRTDTFFKMEERLRLAGAAESTDDFTPYMLSRPERFTIRLIEAPEVLDRPDLRLTLEDEEDWDHVFPILDATASDPLIDYRRLTSLINNQPELCRRMAEMNRERVSRAG